MELIPIVLVIACLWATSDIMQSSYRGLPKLVWLVLFWTLAPISIPLYFFIGRSSSRRGIKFGGSAWGSILGMMFAGPVGAVAGAYLGHSFEKGKEQVDERSVFQINLISILSYVVKVDGHIDQSEIQVVVRIFQKLGFSPVDLTMMSRAFQTALQQNIDLKLTCENFKKCSRYEDRLMLLRMVYMVVMADQKFHAKEKEAIAQIIDYLEITKNDATSIEAEFVQSADKYYTLLGLHKGATLAEVKKAYRKLALTHHPDRVRHLGDEYDKFAEEKFKDISEAYQIILKELN